MKDFSEITPGDWILVPVSKKFILERGDIPNTFLNTDLYYSKDKNLLFPAKVRERCSDHFLAEIVNGHFHLSIMISYKGHLYDEEDKKVKRLTSEILRKYPEIGYCIDLVNELDELNKEIKIKFIEIMRKNPAK